MSNSSLTGAQQVLDVEQGIGTEFALTDERLGEVESVIDAKQTCS